MNTLTCNGHDRESGDALAKDGVLLTIRFKKLFVEEHVETLIYDTGNFLAQAGGNLGLFLGFSCLSMLLAIVNFIRKTLKFKIFQFLKAKTLRESFY